MIHPDDWNQPIPLCRMLGNSMAANVLLRVMIPLVRAVRPELEVTTHGLPDASSIFYGSPRERSRRATLTMRHASQPAVFC